VKHLRAATAGAGVVALLTRGVGVSRPASYVFDEIFYVPDALAIWRDGVEGPGAVHPAAGKAMLAIAMQVAGTGPGGWRAAPLVAGAVTVALVVYFAGRLSRSTPVAIAAGALVCFDGTAFTMSRTAMLDGLEAPLLIAAVGTLALASAHADNGGADDGAGNAGASGRRRVRLGRAPAATIGAALGAATAVKWNTLLLIPTAAFCLAAVTVPARAQPLTRALRVAGTVLGCATAVYLAAHVSWIISWPNSPACTSGCDAVGGVGAFIDHHQDAWQFHSTLEPRNPEAGPLWRWFTEPAHLYQSRNPDGTPDAIVAAPSPLLWATAAGTAAVTVLRRRATAVQWVLLAALWALLLPWAAFGRDGYSFYLAPVAPVAAITVAACAGPAVGERSRTVAAVAVTCAAVAIFAAQYLDLTAAR
jgi:dolichyl-phosphate-mannose-protein mannosyltransferase